MKSKSAESSIAKYSTHSLNRLIETELSQLNVCSGASLAKIIIDIHSEST